MSSKKFRERLATADKLLLKVYEGNQEQIKAGAEVATDGRITQAIEDYVKAHNLERRFNGK